MFLKRLLPALLPVLALLLLAPAASAASETEMPGTLHYQGTDYALIGESYFSDVYRIGTEYIAVIENSGHYLALGVDGDAVCAVHLTTDADGSFTADSGLACLAPVPENDDRSIINALHLRVNGGKYLSLDPDDPSDLVLADSEENACRWYITEIGDKRVLRATIEGDAWNVRRLLCTALAPVPGSYIFCMLDSGDDVAIYQKVCTHEQKQFHPGSDASCLDEGRLDSWYCPDCGSWLDAAGARTFEREGYMDPYEESSFVIHPLGHRYVGGACERCGKAALRYEPVTAEQQIVPDEDHRYILVNEAGGVLGIDHRGEYLKTAVSGASIDPDGTLILDNSADPDGIHAAEFAFASYEIEDPGANWPQDGTALYSALSDDYYSFVAMGDFHLDYDWERTGEGMKYPFSVAPEESGFTAVRAWQYGSWGDPVAFGTPSFGSDPSETFMLGETSNVRLYCADAAQQEPALTPEMYVQRVYEVVLGRTEVDIEGVAHWTDELEGGVSAGEIVREFFRSEEYRSRGMTNEQTVTLCYRAMLGREPDAEGLAAWTAVLDDGYSAAKLVAGFVDAPEFAAVCERYGLTPGSIALTERDRNSNITRFIQRCYAFTLSREPDEAGLNEWCAHLLMKDLDPERVAFGLLFSNEAKARALTDEQFIAMLYRMMLDREPDADGLANWVSALEQNTAAEIAYDAAFETGRSEADAIDQSRQNIYALFAGSAEFGLMIRNYGF